MRTMTPLLGAGRAPAAIMTLPRDRWLAPRFKRT